MERESRVWYLSSSQWLARLRNLIWAGWVHSTLSRPGNCSVKQSVSVTYHALLTKSSLLTGSEYPRQSVQWYLWNSDRRVPLTVAYLSVCRLHTQRDRELEITHCTDDVTSSDATNHCAWQPLWMMCLCIKELLLQTNLNPPTPLCGACSHTPTLNRRYPASEPRQSLAYRAIKIKPLPDMKEL
jgi:hypothetical protein